MLTTRNHNDRMNPMNMADQVRRAIEKCGLSPAAIARATGISKGGLSRFLHGERDMTLALLDRLGPTIGVKLTVTRPKRRKGK